MYQCPLTFCSFSFLKVLSPTDSPLWEKLSRKSPYEVQTLSWIKTYKVTQQEEVNQLLEKLDQGEAEGIILALEFNAEILLLDERKGRKISKSLGLNITGILGILLEAKQKG